MSKKGIMHIYDVSSVVPPKQARWRDVPYANVELNASLAARFNHSIAWLDDRRTLLFMGGSDETNNSILSAWAFNVRTHSAVKLDMTGSIPGERANTVLVKVNESMLVCFGGKNRVMREGRRRPVKVHTPGVYIGAIRQARLATSLPTGASIAVATTVSTAVALPLGRPAGSSAASYVPPSAGDSHPDEANNPPPPPFIKSLLKRKRSDSDSPEKTAQKVAKHVEVLAPEGTGPRSTVDDETKESSEVTPLEVLPSSSTMQPLARTSPNMHAELSDDVRAVTLGRENDRLREECARLVNENEQLHVETLKAKYHTPSLQMNMIKSMLETLATALDDQQNHPSTSQSTVNSSQDSPSDLFVNADGHPLSPAELHDELARTMAAMNEAKKRAAASKEAARAAAKQAQDDEVALHAMFDKVVEVKRAISRDPPQDSTMPTTTRLAAPAISTLSLPPAGAAGTRSSPEKGNARTTSPITPVSFLKRKRSVTDSPEAPQKALKRLDGSRPGGSAGSSGSSTIDVETKGCKPVSVKPASDGDNVWLDSSEESPPTLMPPSQPSSSIPVDGGQCDTSHLLQLENDNGLLRHKLDRLRTQREDRLAEALKAKEQEPSSQLAAIMVILNDLITTRDAHRHFDMNSQSTVNSSQDSPFDLAMYGDGHAVTLAELQWEFDRAVAAAHAARRRAAASERAMSGASKKAETNRDASYVALDKVMEIWNAMPRSTFEADATP
ncbi:hypothetical protein, variant [Aphanomyces invadans]|nr:hypothetical protein, variant [Aphanomyces invadans]ETV98349.1 hypothetical protein, variant [Aphanomyces invadans]|eukprot:XP_008873224.1 hypothetical protein, variant [Aphanomyces invadans]